MADFSIEEIKKFEKEWQQYWLKQKTFKAEANSHKPKYYTLDMFPYPSGAGLHVGHPLGYIATDIVSRFKRQKGFNVLHPMGFDAFGLPAEQYAIQTGQHPAVTTEQNIARYLEQLKNIGFAYDWDREVRTSDPAYYRWTQWIFMQLFNSWYDKKADKARDIQELISLFASEGNAQVQAECDEDTPAFSAADWKGFSEEEKQKLLLKYRLTYISEAVVNWCPALGTVLSNDEVKDGFSERGGHPVERKKMSQWSMRITAYANRLLEGLERIDWPEPVKEMQRNWIGKSMGCQLKFSLTPGGEGLAIEVFTTRVDTIFGATFLVIAPEHELVAKITTPEQKQEVESYVSIAKNRSERERMTEVKRVSGAFTGAYAEHPFTGKPVPVYVADYVLAGYGTGAVMAVPSGDQRDYLFAKHFGLPIIPILDTQKIEEEADPTKEGKYINSDFINGMGYAEATQSLIARLEAEGRGKGKVNFRIRDAIFGRQRYWGEPIPVYFKNGTPYLVEEKHLPITLPEVDKYLPTEDGEPPLARAKNWTYSPEKGLGAADGYPMETTTMPGWAGSSWYWFRYMDPKNETAFADTKALDYWQAVDLYIGGSEHATGHLLYSRFWCKFLFDRGFVKVDEPFKKLINQGMIQGKSAITYRLANLTYEGTGKRPPIYISSDLKDKLTAEYDNIDFKNWLFDEINSILIKDGFKLLTVGKEVTPIKFDIKYLKTEADAEVEVDIERLTTWEFGDFSSAKYIFDITFKCEREIDKMSKSKHNVVNPDDVIAQYGADTLRLYEMFLGPLEQFKPWNTNGISGVFGFLRKFWRLFHDDKGNWNLSEAEPSAEELKSLHKTIKKVEEDIEKFSFNTSVSTFMICVNELSALKCNKRAILEPLTIVLSSYAPHICEELWKHMGHNSSIIEASYPEFKEEYLKENAFEYPVSVNGKMRHKLSFALDMPQAEMEKAILADETVQKWMEGKPVKKLIIVPGRIINLVV
ncbi:class I tRNA ligase family protein [Cytophagales bacterium LB-30]|uniref:Leucine--tRNA ligase n=1 Tax=Shiella aurantiaca TaxID=3058365 RepID=A0ABT8F8L8_9BACT|nr:class I tRNA ligase family protein [Shiella aurantiaca]MDN4166589.1 class I tRNA ligase family protein [Shiella aurantiaca]